MSQTVVNEVPAVGFEGLMADSGLRDIVSRFANQGAAHIPFGKAVVQKSGDDDNQCSLPGATGDVTTRLIGVSIADTSKETDRAIDFGHFKDGESVPVMRSGRIWVIAEDTVTDIDLDVFVRFTDPGGSAPLASLGSFRTDADTADAVAIATGAKWVTTTSAPGELAVLQLNIP